VKVQMLPESSNLELQKAKNPEKYKPPNWPKKKYVPAINDLPKYRQYWLNYQKKTIKKLIDEKRSFSSKTEKARIKYQGF
ncbi:MAG: hypothetical protein GY858_04325, partial [Candidatus Omnitrophica bacterium]|nr:hypothetical protein [Candidatus Omnitrophota bacterium]